MQKLNTILKILIFITLELTFSRAQFECPPNEVPAECEDTCNTCDGNQICPLICTPGCQCMPGYTRDSEMNCIPKQFCPGYSNINQEKKFDPDVRKLLEWEDNKRGCPNEAACKVTCKRLGQSFTNGICTGPNMKHCICFSCPRSAPSKEIAPTGGCPNLSVCVQNCERTGHISGQCTGPKRNNCRCLRRLVAEDSLLSPNTVRGGCPVISLCTAFCNGRGLNSGICLGPKREYCNCYSGLPNLSPNPGMGNIPGSNLPCINRPGYMPCNNMPGGNFPGNNFPGGSDCPNNIANCIIGCMRQGKRSGSCTGSGRATCTCI